MQKAYPLLTIVRVKNIVFVVCLYHYYPQFSSFFIVLVLFNHNVGFMHVVGRLFSSLKLRLSGILMGLCPFSFFRSSIYDRKTIFNA